MTLQHEPELSSAARTGAHHCKLPGHEGGAAGPALDLAAGGLPDDASLGHHHCMAAHAVVPHHLRTPSWLSRYKDPQQPSASQRQRQGKTRPIACVQHASRDSTCVMASSGLCTPFASAAARRALTTWLQTALMNTWAQNWRSIGAAHRSSDKSDQLVDFLGRRLPAALQLHHHHQALLLRLPLGRRDVHCKGCQAAWPHLGQSRSMVSLQHTRQDRHATPIWAAT